MIVYEVNLSVDNRQAEPFAVWLRSHIPEIISYPGFIDASWYYREPEHGRQLWTVHYRVADWRSLQEYFDKYAAEARQEGLDRFGDSFTADRRVLIQRESFSRV